MTSLGRSYDNQVTSLGGSHDSQVTSLGRSDDSQVTSLGRSHDNQVTSLGKSHVSFQPERYVQDTLPLAVPSSLTTMTEYGEKLGMLAFRVTLSMSLSLVVYVVGSKVTDTTAEAQSHQLQFGGGNRTSHRCIHPSTRTLHTITHTMSYHHHQ